MVVELDRLRKYIHEWTFVFSLKTKWNWETDIMKTLCPIYARCLSTLGSWQKI